MVSANRILGIKFILVSMIYGFALINFKNQDNKRLVLYFFMAGLFILIPFILATSPYSILTLFE